jgi:hypothetical protein
MWGPMNLVRLYRQHPRSFGSAARAWAAGLAWILVGLVLLAGASAIQALTVIGGGVPGGGLAGAPPCPDVGGNHLNFLNGVLLCGVSNSGAGTAGNAQADGVTKGLASFTASEFTCTNGICGLQTTLAGKTFPDTTTLTIKGSLLTIEDPTDTSKRFRFDVSGVTTATTRLLKVPDLNDTLVSRTSADTLTNKQLLSPTITTPIGITKADIGLSNVDNTSISGAFVAAGTIQNKTVDNTNSLTLKGSNFTLQDPTDTTKQGVFALSTIPTATTRTYTLPNASDTLACVTCTQTFTNKTLVSPTIAALANLTTNGFVTTSAGNGTLVVDPTTYTATSRAIATTSPLTGGGDFSANRTFACPTCTTNASALTANLPVIGAGSNATAVGTRSGNTTAFVTLAGVATSGTCAQFDANGNVASTGSACGTGGGVNGTVNSGIAGQLPYYATSSNVLSGNPNITINTGALTLGVASSVLGQLLLAGNTSGTVTITPAAAAGTWSLTLPTSGGTSGQFLQTNGAGVATWATAPGAGSVGITGTPVSGQVAEWTSASAIQGVTATGTGSIVRATSPALVTPTGIVKGDVGLGNVDNTSDATKNAAAVTLMNKTLDSSNVLTLRSDRWTMLDAVDATKQLKWQLSGITTGNLRTMTIPDASGTLSLVALAESPSNKTFSSSGFTGSWTGPTLVGGTGTGSVLTLQSTSGVGATDAIIAKVGNNGATEAWRVLTSGAMTLGAAIGTSKQLNINGAIGLEASGTVRGFVGPPTWSATTMAIQNATLSESAANTGFAQNGSGATTINAASGQPVTISNTNVAQAVFASNVLLSYGPNGATNPAWQVDGSTSGANNGLKLTAGVAGTSTPTLAVLSSATNEALKIAAKGTGDLIFQSGATGNVVLEGETARTLGLQRRIGSTNPGLALTMVAGGAASGSTDKAGGDLTLGPGVSTGTGRVATHVQCYETATATGTSDNAARDCVIVGHVKRVSNNVATSVISMTIASGTAVAVAIDYGVEVKNAGGAQQVEGGRVTCTAYNVSGTVTSGGCQKVGNVPALSSGTLAVSWDISAASPAVVTVNANSSLTPSTGFPVVRLSAITNLTGQAMVTQ